MVEIKKMLVPRSRANKVRFSGSNPKRKIVVHQTGNKDSGADAYMHARLQYNGNSRQASWHYQMDDEIIYQSFPHSDRLWHAGNSSINKESIGVEICVNRDGDYDKAVKNGVELVKHLMRVEDISLVEVINHRDASGKWCPSEILGGRENLTWAWFKKTLGGATGSVSQGGSEKAPASKPAYSGSIVDYLTQEGIKSNFGNRKNLAVEYDIINKESDYTGTAKQNTDLLNAMLKGEPKQQGTRKEPVQSGYTGNSIVDYLVSIKKDASFENRKRLASKNGISGYTGTAKQNRDLLNKLRGGGSSGSAKSSTKNVTNYKGDSIVDYLNLSGNSHLGGSSFGNRQKLAKANGISNYTGTASQNRQLLNKLRGGGSSGGSSSKTTSRSARVGDTVTSKALYSTAQSTKNVRSSNIKGYIADIDNSRRNPIRLRNKKGGYYLGFTRQQDLV